MATAAEIRQQADDALATLWAQFQSFQTTYFGNHGKFCQFLRTHSVIPADGNTVNPDIGTAVPSYEGTDARVPLSIRNTALPFALEAHQYVCPDGTCGYVAYVTVTIAGRTWQRCAQVGSESWRAFGWTDVTVTAP